MLETFIRPNTDQTKPRISVVYGGNVPPIEDYEKALGMERSSLEKVPVLEPKTGEPLRILLVQLMNPKDLEEATRNERNTGHFTVYPSPEGLRTLIYYWTDPRFGALLDSCRSKTPPTRNTVNQVIKQIIKRPA